MSICNALVVVGELFDLDRLDDSDPFEIDREAAHLFEHDPDGIDDIYEIWNSDPLFYPANPAAHWLMVADIAGEVLMVPATTPSPAWRPTRPPASMTHRSAARTSRRPSAK